MMAAGTQPHRSHRGAHSARRTCHCQTRRRNSGAQPQRFCRRRGAGSGAPHDRGDPDYPSVGRGSARLRRGNSQPAGTDTGAEARRRPLSPAREEHLTEEYRCEALGAQHDRRKLRLWRRRAGPVFPSAGHAGHPPAGDKLLCRRCRQQPRDRRLLHTGIGRHSGERAARRTSAAPAAVSDPASGADRPAGRRLAPFVAAASARLLLMDAAARAVSRRAGEFLSWSMPRTTRRSAFYRPRIHRPMRASAYPLPAAGDRDKPARATGNIKRRIGAT